MSLNASEFSFNVDLGLLILHLCVIANFSDLIMFCSISRIGRSMNLKWLSGISVRHGSYYPINDDFYGLSEEQIQVSLKPVLNSLLIAIVFKVGRELKMLT